MSQDTSTKRPVGIKIPTWLITSDVSAASLRAYGVLSAQADEDGVTEGTRREMAGMMKCSLRSWDRIVQDLVGVGAIETAPITESRVQVGTRYMLPHPGAGAPRPSAELAPKPKNVRRRRISDTIRLNVYQRDRFRCVTCGTSDDLTLDHISPWSHGGTDEESNLQTMCRSHNSSKGARA